MSISTELDDPIAKIPKRKIKSLIHDSEKSAAAVNLVYLNDTEDGYKRVKKRVGFEYIYKAKKIVNEDELLRIKKLVIPPAWENVWICPIANGHLQVTGIDTRGRKQYKYHTLWNALRNHTKFYRLYEFGNVLPLLRLQIEKDLSLAGLPVNKVIATVVSLMERTQTFV